MVEACQGSGLPACRRRERWRGACSGGWGRAFRRTADTCYLLACPRGFAFVRVLGNDTETMYCEQCRDTLCARVPCACYSYLSL